MTIRTFVGCGVIVPVLMMSAAAGSAAARNATPKDEVPTGAASVVVAARQGDRAGVRALLMRHAGVNVAEVDGTTALHWAVRSDDTELVRMLLRAGAKATAANRYGVTPIALAATNGNVAMIDMLLKAGADPNTAGREGETVLMTAARSGHLEAVKTLLGHGASVNAKEGWYGQTALMWAAAEGHLAVVRALAESGADVHVRSSVQEGFPKWREGKDYRSDNDGNSLQPLRSTFPRGGLTALLYAARQGSVDVAAALVDAGASADEQDPDGLSATTVAIINGHYDVAARLIEKGANVNLPDTWGRAPLFAAVDMHTLLFMPNRPVPKTSEQPDNVQLIKFLLDRGADPNARLRISPPARLLDGGPIDGGDDPVLNGGTTPLLRAAYAADLDVVRILVDQGANPNLTNKYGTNALMAALGPSRWWADPSWDDSESKRLQVIELCLERGHANLQAGDGAGQTALHLAALLGLQSSVRYLVAHGAKLDAKNKQGRTPIEEIVQAPRKDKGRSLLDEKPTEEGVARVAPPMSPATVKMVALLQELAGRP